MKKIIFGALAACAMAALAAQAFQKPAYIPVLPPPPVLPRVPQAPPPPTLAEKALAAKSLRETLAYSVPLMQDVDGEKLSDGALLFAAWASGHEFWQDLLRMPDTKRAEILKDSDSQRGRRICVSGTVTQIFRDKSLPFRAFLGVLLAGPTGFVRFVAVNSTEGVLENQWARFCGITPGVQSYPNVSSGTTHAVQIVGSFDLSARPDDGYY